jgi:hypothetical protein
MSKVSVGTVKCVTCGKEHKVNIYHSINVSLDHDLKEKLISGELTDISCSCGLTLPLRYPILYHKMGFTDIMIHYTQLDIEEVKKQHEEAKLFMGKYIKNPFGSAIMKTEEIIEVYDDWDVFIARIKEIG